MLENPSVGFRLEFHGVELSCYRQETSKPQNATFLTGGDIPTTPTTHHPLPSLQGQQDKGG